MTIEASRDAVAVAIAAGLVAAIEPPAAVVSDPGQLPIDVAAALAHPDSVGPDWRLPRQAQLPGVHK